MLPVNLDAPGMRKKIASEILRDIDAYCKATYDDGHRSHLGASIIGHECSRYLYNTFRWIAKSNFDGRMQRLFNRGHREEARFIEWLRGIGFKVWDVTNDGDQHRVKACSGHFGGSLDGVGQSPTVYGIGEPLLLEFKTKATGRGFADLCERGVQLVAPQHYAQMCIYGRHYGFRYALYMCINKNDDSIHPEIVKLDWQHGIDLEEKAGKIINSQYPPAKRSESPAFHTCVNCTFKANCHEDKIAEKNCRSCRYASPIENSQWRCERHGIIPKDFIPKGCNDWVAID